MEVLNDKVKPPIKVLGKATRSLHYWSVNKFIDPEDDVPFLEEELNPTELGHIYLHKMVVGQWIQVFMPYKLMDSSTGRLVSGLRSFKSCRPYLNGSLPERQLKNPKSCLQHFRLNQEDFKKFSKRVESLGGSLLKDEIDSDDLVNSIRELRTVKETIVLDTTTFREKACRVSSERYYTTEEDLAVALSVFRELRQRIELFHARTVEVVVKYERFSKEVGRETEKTRVSAEFTALKSAQEELRKLPVDRFEREAIHKSRVDLGIDEESQIPNHMRSLTHEINELKAYYKCLERLRVVSNSEIAIDLTGLDISITETTVVVRGDPGALKAYQSENTTVTEEGSGRRRMRNIMLPFESDSEQKQ